MYGVTTQNAGLLFLHIDPVNTFREGKMKSPKTTAPVEEFTKRLSVANLLFSLNGEKIQRGDG